MYELNPIRLRCTPLCGVEPPLNLPDKGARPLTLCRGEQYIKNLETAWFRGFMFH